MSHLPETKLVRFERTANKRDFTIIIGKDLLFTGTYDTSSKTAKTSLSALGSNNFVEFEGKDRETKQIHKDLVKGTVTQQKRKEGIFLSANLTFYDQTTLFLPCHRIIPFVDVEADKADYALIPSFGRTLTNTKAKLVKQSILSPLGTGTFDVMLLDDGIQLWGCYDLGVIVNITVNVAVGGYQFTTNVNIIYPETYVQYDIYDGTLCVTCGDLGIYFACSASEYTYAYGLVFPFTPPC